MGAVDMDRARVEHGHAQAKAESAAVERIAEWYGTESFKQGHRTGYWEGFKRGAENPPATDHVAEAQKHIGWAHEQQSAEGDTGNVVRDDALLAQAHATLALVEQQRVANLLALAASERNIDVPWGAFEPIRLAIREGLGL